MKCPLKAQELLDYLKEELAKLGNHATVTIGFDRHAQRPYVHIPSADRPAQINIPISKTDMPTNDEQYTQEQLLDFAFAALTGCSIALEIICNKTEIDLESTITFKQDEESLSLDLKTLLDRSKAVRNLLEKEFNKED